MKAIRVTCPNCGATLRVAEAATTASCEYCGIASSVMKRSKILERVISPSQSSMPRAVQRHSRAWLGFVLFTILTPLLLTGVCVATSMRRDQERREAIVNASPRAPVVKPADRPPDWQGTDNVLVADADGNGAPELIGRGRRVNAGDIINLMSVDLATGKTRWIGDELGTYGDSYRGVLVLDGDHIYFSHRGELRAYTATAGKLLWKMQLDENVKYFCAGDDASTVNAIGADDVIRPFKRADGALLAKRDAPKANSHQDICPRLPNDEVAPFEQQKAAFENDGKLNKKLDIWVDVVVRGPGGRVVGASRAKGTHITMLVALDENDNERWRQTASPDGLGAEGAPRKIVVGDQETCIIYYGKTYTTACFAMADGKRVWDAETPPFFEGLLIVGRSLIVTGNEIRVHDLDTGRLRWKR